MSRIDNWIDNKTVQNLFIWFFVLIIFIMIIQAENRLITSLLFISFIIPPIYINNLKVLPLFFKGKRKLASILFFMNVAFFTFLGTFFLSDYFQDFHLRMILNTFGGIILVLFFGTSLKLAKDSFTRRHEEKNAELKLLKAQLNPHFLFNTLNNLYGLSVLKSNKLPDLMLKLSDLLRYSLYETKETLVPLEKEIQYLENYISLEKIRLEDKVDIQFQVSGNLSSQKVAPMLLIVFVENAFKHLGILENEKSFVSIKITQEHDAINFKCVNTVNKTEIKNKDLEKRKSGIGLQNAKKRLSLLYSERHNLKIEITNTLYNVNLTLLK